MPRPKGSKNKTKKQPAKKIRKLAVDLDKAQRTAVPISIDSMVEGSVDDEHNQEAESLLDQTADDLDLDMPSYLRGIGL
ncbi:unnamed protein product [marine sediment metagenome]|uniref:Uncharacterized protein n=1 Tax=marine sediment metagenome TaxID=412755 RepID=X1AR95_9ZZZZ